MGLFHNRPFALAAFAAVGLALAASFAGIPHRWIYSLVLLACAVILFLIGLFRRRCGKPCIQNQEPVCRFHGLLPEQDSERVRHGL